MQHVKEYDKDSSPLELPKTSQISQTNHQQKTKLHILMQAWFAAPILPDPRSVCACANPTDMCFNVCINGSHAVAMMDTGASHVFISKHLAHKLRLHTKPSNKPVQIADGKSVSALSAAGPKTIKLEGIKTHAHAIVFDALVGGVDVILGESWIKRNSVILDYCTMHCIITDQTGADKHIPAAPQLRDDFSLPSFMATQTRPLEVISKKHANKLCAQGCKSFLIFVRKGQQTEPCTVAAAQAHAACTSAQDTKHRHEQDSGLIPEDRLHLYSGYHQIKNSTEDCPKTAFRTPLGHFEFKVLPFGLANAPATFQSLMNKIFAPIKDFAEAYMDDIIVRSKNAHQHEDHLRQLFQLLRHHGLYAKLPKCTFNKPEVHYLEHVIGRDGLKVDPQKIQTVAGWPTPKDVHEVRQFLGLTNYFRKFIYHYADIAAPLQLLANKGQPFNWGGDQDRAFEKLKCALCAAPVLAIPDLNRPFEVISDASMVGT
eukprot:1153928-Pelagomonas_calceolata.AAC.2